MPGRIEVDPKAAVLGRLMNVQCCAELEDPWLGGIDVPNAKVEVELLRMGARRPSRRAMVINSLKGKCRSSIGVVRGDSASWRDEGRPVTVGAVLDTPIKHAPIELSQAQSIRTVHDDEVQLG